MVKKALLILYGCIFSMAGYAQTVLFINAGSRASWGNNQEITIDSRGNGKYVLREVNGPVKDSSQFSITAQQLDELLLKADQSGFFTLDALYKGRAVDGAGIYISLKRIGKTHQVQVINTDQPVINELVTQLNSLLSSFKILINYGQFVKPGN